MFVLLYISFESNVVLFRLRSETNRGLPIRRMNIHFYYISNSSKKKLIAEIASFGLF